MGMKPALPRASGMQVQASRRRRGTGGGGGGDSAGALTASLPCC